ncbi:retrotransposon gag family protein, partial [Bartonella sp. AC134YNZD]|uniref:retrotransposon gag family protein n=1 Tax=Bartonella sp. AC134YNZD TaxID=3243446 RepID=UPI0035D002B8
QHLPTFHCMDFENPYTHISDFEAGSVSCTDQRCTLDTVRLSLFPFSLKDKAKQWLSALEPRSIWSWQAMSEAFLNKFFPASRTASFKRQLMTFNCQPQETFYQVWEHFKDLLMACPHHGFDKGVLVSFFYESLTPTLKQLVTTTVTGEFYAREADEAFDHLNQLAETAREWDVVKPNQGQGEPRASGKFTLRESDDMQAKLATLTRQVETLTLEKAQSVTIEAMRCSVCGNEGHKADVCPSTSVQAMYYGQNVSPGNQFRKPYPNQNQGFNPYSETIIQGGSITQI